MTRLSQSADSQMLSSISAKPQVFSSTSSYAFSMPKLNDFAMEICSQIEYFTFLKASTPMAHVYTSWEVWEDIPDLNDYIRQNCKRESSSSHGVKNWKMNRRELKKSSLKSNSQSKVRRDHSTRN
ncbi:hypothetical protein POM88_037349 [Heracleum sosnowskyi]|uniref:Uncharacterized protein n=1 Tax=Heracleum sosnowskyi TaxID=360622 RepID=A0AAD8HPY7_9APIA|nr:hypothetical protein POM88_037349 [Heracleum sosnowskyi]